MWSGPVNRPDRRLTGRNIRNFVSDIFPFHKMIRAGALVAVNHSGDKDSQAMTILLSRIVLRDRLVAVHAPLGEVEWPGTVDHIRATLPAGVPLILAPVASGKTLLHSIEERGRFPSPAVRWCTSSLKRGPIERELRRYLKAHPRFGGRIVSAMGMRAEESAARARKPSWRLNDRNSRAGRTWFDWLPIFNLTERQVFRVIRDAGQPPHPAYATLPDRIAAWRERRAVDLMRVVDTRHQSEEAGLHDAPLDDPTLAVHQFQFQ